MKILILNPNQIKRYNWGHQLFRNEIGKQADYALFYGPGFPNFNPKLNVNQIIKRHFKGMPDVIMTYGWRYSKDFKGLGSIKNIAKVHITVDYVRKKGFPKQNQMFKENKYDLVFAITQTAMKNQIDNKVCDKVRLLPFSVDTNIYRNLNLPTENFILTSYSNRVDVYPNRNKVRQAIKEMGYKATNKRIIHNHYVNAINKCRIAVTSNNIFKSLSMRYTEVLACGGFLLADKPDDFTLLGYENNKHLVLYDDIKDLKEKVKYYMNPKNNKERVKIAKKGMKFVRKNHSCKVRAQEFYDMITDELLIK
jgi:hypothetical protein